MRGDARRISQLLIAKSYRARLNDSAASAYDIHDMVYHAFKRDPSVQLGKQIGPVVLRSYTTRVNRRLMLVLADDEVAAGNVASLGRAREVPRQRIDS